MVNPQSEPCLKCVDNIVLTKTVLLAGNVAVHTWMGHICSRYLGCRGTYVVWPISCREICRR